MAVACDMPQKEKKQEKEEFIYILHSIYVIYLDYYSRLEDFGLLRLDY